jgi:flavin-dependent dehydrogenase
MRQTCDVCVFGAGPAGAATAARLADFGVSVILLDRPPRNKPWRGESLTGAIRHPLTTLGLWRDFCAAEHVPTYEQRTAWGGEPWTKDSIFHSQGNLWHVDRARFDDDLRRAALQRGVPLIEYVALHDLRRDREQWLLTADDDIEVSSNYLVDATGRASAIARRLGARSRVCDRLVGLTALLTRNENPEFSHAMVIESTPHGWWYAAPVPQGHVLAFFTDADLAPRELARSMRTVAANSAFTQGENGQGWLTVGDACAAHDPLCGWGVSRAMTNGILAADAIACFVKSGDASLIEQYLGHCRTQFEQYLTGLTKHYSFEQRWAAFPFWERRANWMVSSTSEEIHG